MGHEFGVGLAYAYRSHGIKGVVAISGQAMASGKIQRENPEGQSGSMDWFKGKF
jgi:hypothetical protein